MVSIHPGRINLYHEIKWHRPPPRRDHSANLSRGFHASNGKVSTATRRKINKAIEYLLFLSSNKDLPDTEHGKAYKFRLAFVTLTLPSSQQHTDIVIKEKCLNQFLIEARKRWKVRNYLWRAEKQRNGNIHFHVLTDKFIPWSELRDTWNRITNKLQYVDRYRDQMREFHSGGPTVRRDLLKNWSYKAQIKAYQKGKANDWSSPNSTDIHSVYKIRNLKGYISKYCTKDEQSEGLSGRLWGCNYQLSDIPGARCIMDNTIHEAVTRLFEKHSPRSYSGEYFTTFFIDLNMLINSDSDVLFRLLAGFIFDHFGVALQQNCFNSS